MKCPRCKVNLSSATKLGVTIDYCPKCEGAWLDKGEIEKISEKLIPTALNKNGEKETSGSDFELKNKYVREHEDERFDYEHHGSKKPNKDKFMTKLF